MIGKVIYILLRLPDGILFQLLIKRDHFVVMFLYGYFKGGNNGFLSNNLFN